MQSNTNCYKKIASGHKLVAKTDVEVEVEAGRQAVRKLKNRRQKRRQIPAADSSDSQWQTARPANDGIK